MEAPNRELMALGGCLTGMLMRLGGSFKAATNGWMPRTLGNCSETGAP